MEQTAERVERRYLKGGSTCRRFPRDIQSPSTVPEHLRASSPGATISALRRSMLIWGAIGDRRQKTLQEPVGACSTAHGAHRDHRPHRAGLLHLTVTGAQSDDKPRKGTEDD